MRRVDQDPLSPPPIRPPRPLPPRSRRSESAWPTTRRGRRRRREEVRTRLPRPGTRVPSFLLYQPLSQPFLCPLFEVCPTCLVSSPTQDHVVVMVHMRSQGIGTGTGTGIDTGTDQIITGDKRKVNTTLILFLLMKIYFQCEAVTPHPERPDHHLPPLQSYLPQESRHLPPCRTCPARTSPSASGKSSD